ncbi:MAG: histidine--tRNA ligase [Planctomycetota bacterium]|nr:MAG: histidine--tRNA ligase [Planctomycetota bacterium]
MKFRTVKGTRDFYPTDMAIRNWIVDTWKRVSLNHGFEEYDSPIFEYLDLFKAKSGEAIVSELFHFTDRGDRELAIRPEMTPSLARMINARAQSLPLPIKWFSVPRLCRAERPQRGRLREFFQWNIDIVGIDDAVTDAECIFVAVDFFRQIGLTPADIVMKINSRALLAALLSARGFAENRHADIFVVLDKRDKLSQDDFIKSVEKITQSGSRRGKEKTTLIEIGQAHGKTGLESLAGMAEGNKSAERELTRLRNVFDILNTLGVADYCEFDMGIVRGLAYYTGVVFEAFGKAGLKRAICGGGRYDQLLEVLGGPPMSGTGFGTSDVVILDLLIELNHVPTEATISKQNDFYVIDADANLFNEVLSLVAKLRKAGFAAEFSYRRQAIGKQIKQAAANNTRWAVIVGNEYTERGVLSVKDLDTGEQVEIPIRTFLDNPHAPMGK